MDKDTVITRYLKMDRWGRFTLSQVDREMLGLNGGETFEVSLKFARAPPKKEPSLSKGCRLTAGGSWFSLSLAENHKQAGRWWYGWKKPSPRQKQKSDDQKGKAKKEESEVMSEARDIKMKRKRRLEELKAT